MALKNLLKTAETYDFREEIVAFSYEDPMERHAVYQAIGIAENSVDNKGRLGLQAAQDIYEKYDKVHRILARWVEADNCSLFQTVCRLLWDDTYLTACTDGAQIKGDTMNSVNTTLNRLFRGSEMWKVVLLLCGSKSRCWSETLTVWLYSQSELSHYRDIIQSCNGAKDFLSVAYTIGNFIPCPVDCNKPRGRGFTKDYWDLALFCIYKWYQNHDDMHIEKIVGLAKVAVYRSWLESFGNWDTFVQENFMQPFVHGADDESDAPKDGPFGKPKELWGGHFDAIEEPNPKKVLPIIIDKKKEEEKKINQTSEFFKNATVCIKARSKLMVDELRKRSENQGKE